MGFSDIVMRIDSEEYFNVNNIEIKDVWLNSDT